MMCMKEERAVAPLIICSKHDRRFLTALERASRLFLSRLCTYEMQILGRCPH